MRAARMATLKAADGRPSRAARAACAAGDGDGPGQAAATSADHRAGPGKARWPGTLDALRVRVIDGTGVVGAGREQGRDDDGGGVHVAVGAQRPRRSG